jgi:Uncharacterized protein conserved in bacteria (DUF2252)
MGKALCRKVRRQDHAAWEPPEGRRDPVDLLCESNEGRLPHLIPIRFGRMSQSPFAFYRGAAALMAADLASTAKSGLTVQACGDAHLMNFGGFATPERNIVFDINDFDETLPAPWEWDLKRGGRQRRYVLWRGPLPRGRRRPDFPANQGSQGVGARTLCGQEHLLESGATRRDRPSYDAVGERHVPRMVQGGGGSGRHYYVRQLRDAKISAVVEGFDLILIQDYARLCAWALARTHARSGDPAMIAGYMGASATFDDAIGEFAMEYADHNERDYRGFIRAIKEGRIEAAAEV